jgi:putative oxidoreductase
MLHKLLHTNNDPVLTVVRLVLGIVFFAHGAQKMLGWFGGYGYTATMGFFEHNGIPAVFAFLAIAAEFFGGIGLLLGLLSRVAAFGITCNMLVAIATLHHRFGLFMNWTGQQKGEGFEFHLLVLAITFLIIVRGAGALSLDRLLTRSSSTEAQSRPLAKAV